MFRADASLAIGGGHVMRCLALADALARRSAQIAFVCARTIQQSLEERVRQAGYELHLIESPGSSASRPERDQTVFSGKAQQADAERTLEAAGEAEWCVVDHYRLGEAWEKAVRSRTERILVLDDLANRHHACHLLLDHSVGRMPEDYRGLVPEKCEVLTGGEFKLLRPEFAAARASVLQKRQQPGPVQAILISLGLTDFGGTTSQAMRQALDSGIAGRIDVVLGSGTAAVNEVSEIARANPQVRLHLDVKGMAPLIAAADLCVGAGGMTSFERCCLGLPTLSLILAENQRSSLLALAASGVTEVVHALDALPGRIRALAVDPARRRKMAIAGLELCDGRGAERVADRMLDWR